MYSGFSDRAAKCDARPRIDDLKRVGIDQSDEGGIRDQDVRLVHIPYDIAAAVQRVDGGSQVARDAMQRQIVERGVVAAAGAGIVAVEQRLCARDARHEVACKAWLGFSAVEQVERPGDREFALNGQGIVRRVREHGAQFLGARRFGLVVDLRDILLAGQHGVDPRLPACAERGFRGKNQRKAIGLSQQAHGLAGSRGEQTPGQTAPQPGGGRAT